jgi:hypothetical protein
MFFDRDNQFGLLGRADDLLLIDRLDGGQMQHTRRDTVSFEELRGLDAAKTLRSRGDQ